MFEFLNPTSQEAYDKALKLYKKNHKKGMDKMKKLCDKRNPKAAIFIRNSMIVDLKNITDENEKAKQVNIINNLLRLAADFGDVNCQYTMAKLFEKGEVFEKSPELSFKYLLMAAKNGDAKAHEWFLKAADNGSSGAMANIGCMHYDGRGFKQNYEIAFKWFTMAVDSTANTFAMFMLGKMYEKGLYVEKNMDMAIDWYKKAELQGSPDASERLKEIGV